MKSIINSNPSGLRHTKLVQRPAAQLGSITTDHEFMQQTVAQIYKTPCHKDFVQGMLAQLSSGQNEKRPPLKMEPSIDDPLAAVKGIMRHPYFYVNNSTEAGGVTI